MIPALIHTFVSSLCKNQPLVKRHSQQPIIFDPLPRFFNGFVSWSLPTFFAYVFAAVFISHKISPGVFWFFNCARKMSILAQMCVSLTLSLMGCFGSTDSISCTHPASSMLSSTLTDCSFLTRRGSSCLSDNFSNHNECPPLFVDFFFHQRLGFH